MSVVEIVLAGLVVGAIARLLVPGRDPIGVLGTLGVGVAGALVGWWAGRSLVGARNVGLHPWLWAIGGAVLVMLLLRAVYGRRRRWLPTRRRWVW